MSDLLKINVNDHTEKKGQLTYLSWAWAWAEVLKIDPGATWVVHTYGPQGSEQPCMWIGDTAMVHTSVTVKGLRRECMLPVMDHKNNALKQPDARKISDAIMRCMTKAISMHGLGLYIYAGEDLPESEEQPKTEQPKPEARQRTGVAADLLAMAPAIPEERKAHIDKLAVRVTENFTAYGAQSAYEVIHEEGLDDIEKVYLSTMLASNVRNPIKAYSHQVNGRKAA